MFLLLTEVFVIFEIAHAVMHYEHGVVGENYRRMGEQLSFFLFLTKDDK